MTSKLTRERIELIANFHRAMTLPPSHDEIEELARIALAEMDSEPVAEVVSVFGDSESIGERELKLLVGIQNMPYGTKFYRHAQPAPETEREPIAWLNDAYLARGVVDGEAGSEDAGPGYIPVYREASPAQPAPVVPEKATVGEMPFLGASEGVYVRGWNDCRAAMFQAGNSPVIPAGYVKVPKEPTKEMIDAGWLHFMGTKNPSSKGTYKAMHAAAPQEVKP